MSGKRSVSSHTSGSTCSTRCPSEPIRDRTAPPSAWRQTSSPRSEPRHLGERRRGEGEPGATASNHQQEHRAPNLRRSRRPAPSESLNSSPRDRLANDALLGHRFLAPILKQFVQRFQDVGTRFLDRCALRVCTGHFGDIHAVTALLRRLEHECDLMHIQSIRRPSQPNTHSAAARNVASPRAVHSAV